MKKTRLFYAALLSLLLAFGLCHHALAAGEGTRLADFYLTKLPAPALAPSPTLDQAMKIQAEFNGAITPYSARWWATRQDSRTPASRRSSASRHLFVGA